MYVSVTYLQKAKPPALAVLAMVIFKFGRGAERVPPEMLFLAILICSLCSCVYCFT